MESSLGPAPTPAALGALVHQKRSLLCLGIDPVTEWLPQSLRTEPDPWPLFVQQVVQAVGARAVAYKLNLAFFEALGTNGMGILQRCLAVLPPGALVIADGKRGDIGSSSEAYVRALYHRWGFHAATVSPYMGHDSVAPFLVAPGRWTFLLAATSNPGAQDFQFQATGPEQWPLYERVVRTAEGWPHSGPLGYVAGATRPEVLARIRAAAPQAWLLVPGVGAQGGSVAEVCQAGLAPGGGLLINVTRSVLYASAGPDYAHAAAQAAESLVQEMRACLPA